MKTLLQLAEMIDHLPAAMKDAIHAIAKTEGKKTDELSLHRFAYSEKAKTNQMEPEKRLAQKYVSARTVDRDGEIVVPKGIDLSEFMKYAHVLVNHNYSLLPVGSDESIEADDFGIKATTRYADTGLGTLPDLVWKLVSQGHMKASSIGFVPVTWSEPKGADWDRVTNKLQSEWPEFGKGNKSLKRVITKGVLLEHSDVSMPCNVDAELIGIVKGYGAEDKVLKQLGFTEGDVSKPDGSDLWAVMREGAGAFGDMDVVLKPFPSEHAARITDPDKYKKFARQNGKFGPGIHAIWGITEDGKTELQAIRFSKDKFTPDEAKRWLKDHDRKPMEFEDAKEAEKAVEVEPVAKAEGEESMTTDNVCEDADGARCGNKDCPAYGKKCPGEANCPMDEEEDEKPEAEKAAQVINVVGQKHAPFIRVVKQQEPVNVRVIVEHETRKALARAKGKLL